MVAGNRGQESRAKGPLCCLLSRPQRQNNFIVVMWNDKILEGNTMYVCKEISEYCPKVRKKTLEKVTER